MFRRLSLGVAALMLAAVTMPASATITVIAVYCQTTVTCTVCGTVAAISASCVGKVSISHYARGVPHKGIFSVQYVTGSSLYAEALPRLGTEPPQAQVDRYLHRNKWETHSVCDSKYGTCTSNVADMAVACRKQISYAQHKNCWGGAVFYQDGQVAAAFIGSPMTSVRSALQALHYFANSRGSLADRVVGAGAAVPENGEGDLRCARSKALNYVSTDSSMIYIHGCTELKLVAKGTAGYICTFFLCLGSRPPPGTYGDALLEIQHRYLKHPQRPSYEPILFGCVVTECKCWGSPTAGTIGVHIPCPCPPIGPTPPAPPTLPTPPPTVTHCYGHGTLITVTVSGVQTTQCQCFYPWTGTHCLECVEGYSLQDDIAWRLKIKLVQENHFEIPDPARGIWKKLTLLFRSDRDGTCSEKVIRQATVNVDLPLGKKIELEDKNLQCTSTATPDTEGSRTLISAMYHNVDVFRQVMEESHELGGERIAYSAATRTRPFRTATTTERRFQ